MGLFKKISSITLVGVLTSSAFLFPVGDKNVSANSSEKNEKEELQFELSPDGRYDITFKDKGNGKATMEAMSKSRTSGAEISVVGEYKYSPNTVTVEMNDKAIKALAKNPNVVKIEPDLLVKQSAVYSAPFYGDADWVIKGTRSDVAYTNGYSGQGVKVAVLDSGIDTDHPMLAHAIKGGASVVNWSNDYEDITGHGTEVAGTIASKWEGKPYGIAPDVDLYAVKVTSDGVEGGGHPSDIARGIEWAVDNGMDAITISFEPAHSTTAYENASRRAYDSKVPIFHASGNFSTNRDLTPGKCGNIGTYCVSALLKNNELASFSSYGRENIPFSSYGGGVPITKVGINRPWVASGTSFATPMAMGTFALYKSKYPTMNGNQIIQMMKNNSLYVSQLTTNKAVANLAVFEDGSGNNPEPEPITPNKPVVSLVSVNGKNVTVRVTAPDIITTFNKIELDYSWVEGLTNRTVYVIDTRTYAVTFEVPNYNTTYQINARVFNNDMPSDWSSSLSFTSGAGQGSIAPQAPSLSLVSVSGKTVTIRATVPSASATFNKLKFNYGWVAGTNDKIVNMNDTRTYDYTFEAPNFNTTYQIDATAFNGDLESGWSNALTFITGQGSSNGNGLFEDFSDNIFDFSFSGQWYRDPVQNVFRSSLISDNMTSTTTFTVNGGANGAQLSIDYKTSSEAGYDKLNIYVNDVLKRTDSGVNADFKNLFTTISAGNSTVKLEYIKDGSASSGDDAVYVDNIKVIRW